MSYELMESLRTPMSPHPDGDTEILACRPAAEENISITRTETETDTVANAASGLIGRTRRNDYAYENDIG